MAASNDVVCGVCDALQVTKSASYWCPECEEGLCSECLPHHMFSKASRHHEVIPIESYKKLPPSISEIIQYCREHELKYTNFCQQHSALCCPGCISSSHKNCVGRMVLLQEIIKVSKTSSTLENIEKYCKDLEQNIGNVEKDWKQNLSKIQEQRQMIQTEIQQLRVKINSHFDRLEKDITTKLLNAEDEIRLKIETLLTQLSAESKSLNKLHSNILAVKDYASDLQTFLGIKTFEEEVEKKEMVLKSLLKDGQLNLTFQINDMISQTLSTVTEFGSVYRH